jgi:hypothetical protein
MDAIGLNLLNGSILPRVSNKLQKALGDKNKESLQLGLMQLIYMTLKETAEAIENAEYTKFDALVKNFGCQMTMIEVIQLSQTDGLYESAQKLKELARSRLEESQQLGAKNRSQNIAKLTESAQRDMQSLSKEIVRLARLRLLCIVNSNKETKDKKSGALREMPITNIEPLLKKLPAIRKVLEPIASPLIEQLQIEESLKAALFIRNEASMIEGERSPLLQKALGANFLRRAPLIDNVIKDKGVIVSMEKMEGMGIASVPLLYNTEVALGRHKGVVLIKNKLKVCEKPIEGALDIKALFMMPEGRPLTDSEVASLNPNQTIAVIEGYIDSHIKSSQELSTELVEKGIMNIVRANCARADQYAHGVAQDPFDDDEANKDIEALKLTEGLMNTIEIDHMFCASAKEVLAK